MHYIIYLDLIKLTFLSSYLFLSISLFFLFKYLQRFQKHATPEFFFLFFFTCLLPLPLAWLNSIFIKLKSDGIFDFYDPSENEKIALFCTTFYPLLSQTFLLYMYIDFAKIWYIFSRDIFVDFNILLIYSRMVQSTLVRYLCKLLWLILISKRILLNCNYTP